MASKKNEHAEKAAAVVIALGAENASNVYKFLREDEIEQISLEIAKMEKLSPEEFKDIMEDFYGLCVTKKVIAEGGVEYAKDVLEKAFGTQAAMSLMDRVSKSLKTKAFDFVRKADSKNMLNLLQNEHPQTIALVLSYARADQASEIISELPSELRV
ncbi:MAG: flagellar motor switch protein FliG, partial [Angelakisella sp.]